MSVRQMLRGGVVALCGALLMTGCASSFMQSSSFAPTSTAHTGSSDEGDGPAGPPPIILKDTSPGQLTLTVSLAIGGYEADTRDKADLDVVFTSQGRVVQFVAGESVSCNGIALQGHGTNFYSEMPSDKLSGRRITCTYTSGKASATFTFTAPLAPAILSPQEHAQVIHSKRTLVRYRISQDWAFYVIALGPNTKAWTPTARSQPNPATLDTSAFPPGAGSLAINQFFTLTDLRGPAFHSAGGQGGAEYAIQITWV